MTTRDDRIQGGLLGLLIGDALGVPYEFHGPDQLPPRELIEMEPPADFRRAHPRTPPGTWSDDGAQALCLLVSLLEHGSLELDEQRSGADGASGGPVAQVELWHRQRSR